ncbi:MAG: cation transporter, partial [Clostridia bacterium]|nr:cation transporter [Clostridia bacterium]
MLNKKPKAEAFGFCSYIFIFLPEAINANDESANSIAAIVITEASPVGVVLNLLLAGLKICVGILAMSLSVVADAVNNLSDAGSSVISFISFKISAKPADRDHPHGHARIEYVTSMIVGMIVIVVGFELLLNSVRGLISPSGTTAVKPLTLILLGVAILAKLWLGLFNFRIGKRIDSSVMRATGVDSLSDSVSTLAVLVGALLSYVFPEAAFTPYIDGAMGLLV